MVFVFVSVVEVDFQQALKSLALWEAYNRFSDARGVVLQSRS